MNTYFQANAILSKFSRNYMELKKNLPVRPSELGVLNILANTPGPHTALLLKDMLGVSKSMIAAHISVLEKKGYVIKRQSTDDKRMFFLTLTDKARDLVDAAQRTMQAQLDNMIRKLGEDRFAALVQLADEANRIMEASDLNDEAADDHRR